MRIDKIRPAVLAAKQKYQNQKMNNLQQIEARVGKRLQALREKHDNAVTKIDSHELSDREPIGGIEKQYSIRDSTAERIKEMEDEREEQIAAVSEKYDELIDQAESRIDILEEEKQGRLTELRRKIGGVEAASRRLNDSIDGLVSDHESVASVGFASGIARPHSSQEDRFLVHLPTVIAKLEDGTKSRNLVLTASAIKEGKGSLGSLKGLVGMKFAPLETVDESFLGFVESYRNEPELNAATELLAADHNILRASTFRDLASSGITKMQERGWLREKEAIEFGRAVQEFYVPSRLMPSVKKMQVSMVERGTSQTKVRFLNSRGVEQWVTLKDVEALRRADLSDFESEAGSLVGSVGISGSLTGFLRGLRIPYSKSYCIDKGEVWVQYQLHSLLANSQFRTNLQRERVLSVGDISGRIDFDVGGIGIEVKIFRSMQDFDRLTREILLYGENYDEILVPFINAGGLSNDQLDDAFALLMKKIGKVRAYFPLNCSEHE